MIRSLAILIGRLAGILLPAPLRHWGRAMQAEIGLIHGALAALVFALGCLGCAIRQVVFHHILHPIAMPFAMAAGALAEREEFSMRVRSTLLHRPRTLAALCAVSAVGLGMIYLTTAGAPARYLAMNGAALLLGFVVLGILSMANRAGLTANGVVAIALAAALFLTSVFGLSSDGVTRWVSVSGIALQPSLVLLPALILSFARCRDRLSTIAIAIASLALALQPDRAMAGALFAGLVTLAWVHRERNVHVALVAALIGMIVTLLRPDNAPAALYVDQIFYSSFDVSALAGLAVVTGAVLMIVPAIAGALLGTARREIYAVFGVFWLAVIVAAALGNYPTPLVGYGGSAILGYIISLTGLPATTAAAGLTEAPATPSSEADESGDLRTSLRYAL
ncbi:hypothetical protein [Sphingomonas sp. LT1P40]|uniref:hypothetical protein n=1 Tax=Alteristakelama amylovorans TaxID=3096166 RepID=UPI002FC7D16F